MIRIFIIPVLLFSIACVQDKNDIKGPINGEPIIKNIITESYELILPEKQNGFLILFPCFPCNAENTKTEFDIADIAVKHNIAVLLMNFNQHLWLSENEKKTLESLIVNSVKENHINTNNTFIGGFSSGGNVSLLLTNYFKSTNSLIQPKGLFIVDSPIDLLGLYEDAQKDIAKNYSETAVQEANWIVETFNSEFGIGDTSLIHYENKSPYSSKNHTIKNLYKLKDLKIRFYSEPDTIWWKENRQTEYEDMNAYYIEQLAIDLNKSYGENSVTYIKTKNKGFRANGERHPHSWSIVDQKNLIDWMIKN